MKHQLNYLGKEQKYHPMDQIPSVELEWARGHDTQEIRRTADRKILLDLRRNLLV